MAIVLTANAAYFCGHAGSITIASNAKLTVNGFGVVTADMVKDKPLTGICNTTPVSPPPPPSTKCIKVVSVTSAGAGKLTVNGVAVLLDPLKGTTNGVVSGVAQAKLEAKETQTVLTAT